MKKTLSGLMITLIAFLFCSRAAYGLTDTIRNQMARAPLCFFVYLLQSGGQNALTFSPTHQLMIAPFDQESARQVWRIRPALHEVSATISPLIDAHAFLIQDNDQAIVSAPRMDAPFFPNWLFTLFVSQQNAYVGIQQYQTHAFLEFDGQSQIAIQTDRKQLRGWQVLDASTGKSCASLLSSQYPEQPVDIVKECRVIQLYTADSQQALRCPISLTGARATLSDRFAFPTLGPADENSVFHVQAVVSPRGELLASLYNPYGRSALTILQRAESSVLQCVPLSPAESTLPFMFSLRADPPGLGMYTRYGDPLLYDTASSRVWVGGQWSAGNKEWRVRAYPSGEDCSHFFHQMTTDRRVTGFIYPLFFPSPVHITASTSFYSSHHTRFYFGSFSDEKDMAIFSLMPEDVNHFGHHKVLRLNTGECVIPRLGVYDYDADRMLHLGSCDVPEAHRWSYGTFDRRVPHQMQFCIDGLSSPANGPLCLGISHTDRVFLTPQRDRAGRLSPSSLMVFSSVQDTAHVIPVFLSVEGECLGIRDKQLNAILMRFPCQDQSYDKRFYQVLPFQEEARKGETFLFMLAMRHWQYLSSGAWQKDTYCLGVANQQPQLMRCTDDGSLLWHRQNEQLCSDEYCLHADGFVLPTVHMLPQGTGTSFERTVDVTPLKTVSDYVFFRLRNIESGLCLRAPVIEGQPLFMATCYPHLSSYDDLYELFSPELIDADLALKTGNGLRTISYGMDTNTHAAALLFSIHHAQRHRNFSVFLDQDGRLFLQNHALGLSETPVFAVEEVSHRHRHLAPQPPQKHRVLVDSHGPDAHWLLVPYLADQYVFQ